MRLKALAAAVVVVLAALLSVSCTESTSLSGPSLDSEFFSSISYTPQEGSSLRLGQQIVVKANCRLPVQNLFVGVAAIREDGATFINTIGGGFGSAGLSCTLEGGFGLSPQNGFYDFAKGHTVDLLLVMGHTGMLLYHGTSLNQDAVVFQQRVPTRFRIL
ncbi:MAG: hypothetical protein IT406_03040 [Candidatus Yanofskybacteria bacterium]|nr:hypothetical protein [Candidatus Yanofskybacteria bacterium]